MYVASLQICDTNFKGFLSFIDYIQSALHVQYTLIKNLKMKHSVNKLKATQFCNIICFKCSSYHIIKAILPAYTRVCSLPQSRNHSMKSLKNKDKLQ